MFMIIMDNKSLLLKVVESRLQQKETQVVVQVVKNLPAMRETWVRSLGWEDSLEKCKTTPVFWPGEFHGQRSLVGYSPWGYKESNMTERLTQTHKLMKGFLTIRVKKAETLRVCSMNFLENL